MVVPFVAGGTTDIFARMTAQHLNEAWKQPVVIDNRAGAAGNIGTELVAKATPDGYTLLMASPGFVINSTLHKRAGFDPLKDFAAVIFVSLTPLVVTVHPTVPAKTLAELIDLARKQPGKLNFASAGSSTHLAAELLKSRAQIDITHIPYKGTAPAGTPPAIVEQLNREVNRMLARPEVRNRMAAIGAEPGSGSAQDFHRFIEQETDKWAKLINSIGLREQ